MGLEAIEAIEAIRVEQLMSADFVGSACSGLTNILPGISERKSFAGWARLSNVPRCGRRGV
jgi:hypothetical protein